MIQRKRPMPEESAEVVAKGKAVYDAGIRAQVETMENLGKILFLDVDTGEYVISEDERVERIEKNRAMIQAKPDIRIFGIRIGYPTLSKFGNPPNWKPTIAGKPVTFAK